jgi:hypothetical protein
MLDYLHYAVQNAGLRKRERDRLVIVCPPYKDLL